jgi:DNA-directed RNA polymerase II subunit RPB9
LTKSEQTMMLTDLSTDPTLVSRNYVSVLNQLTHFLYSCYYKPRANVQCAMCGHPEAVFFQSSSRRSDAKMTLFYVCGSRGCGHRWTE